MESTLNADIWFLCVAMHRCQYLGDMSYRNNLQTLPESVHLRPPNDCCKCMYLSGGNDLRLMLEPDWRHTSHCPRPSDSHGANSHCPPSHKTNNVITAARSFNFSYHNPLGSSQISAHCVKAAAGSPKLLTCSSQDIPISLLSSFLFPAILHHFTVRALGGRAQHR